MLDEHLDKARHPDPSILFLIIAILIGGFIRLSLVLGSDFPINDGGLFYSMTSDLLANNFRLPPYTSYNQMEIPFAYPPLSFYFSGFLIRLFSWSLLDIIRILPAVFTILSIPAFFLLASKLVSNKFQLILATLIFTFIPTSFNWLIMGGGLTRSPAFFFSLFSLFFIYQLFSKKNPWYIIGTVGLSALTILTHPEAAVHTAATALVFFVFYGRNKSGVRHSIIAAFAILILTAPWWVTAISRHGLSPFISAGGTGLYNLGQIFRLFQFNLTHEYGLQSIGVLGLIGFFISLAKRDYFQPVWLLASFFSEPRSATLFLSPCIALLASRALLEIFQLISQKTTDPDPVVLHPLSGKFAGALFVFLFGQWVFSASVTMFILGNTVISAADRKAFEWIQTHTPTESQFLVLTGFQPLSDPIAEWFPALTQRISVATVQGYEWKRVRSFEELVIQAREVKYCASQTFSCLIQWSEENQSGFDYVYIHNLDADQERKTSPQAESALGVLSRTHGVAKLVYDVGDGVFIYKVR